MTSPNSETTSLFHLLTSLSLPLVHLVLLVLCFTIAWFLVFIISHFAEGFHQLCAVNHRHGWDLKLVAMLPRKG